jgi:hypothetical protein
MAQPTSYEEFFEQALLAPNGIAVDLDTKGQAINFMQKMNSHRVRQRKTNCKVYPEDHPMHNKTPWDNLVLRLDKENESSVLIQPGGEIKVKKVRQL